MASLVLPSRLAKAVNGLRAAIVGVEGYLRRQLILRFFSTQLPLLSVSKHQKPAFLLPEIDWLGAGGAAGVVSVDHFAA